jgi:hypothetical protein
VEWELKIAPTQPNPTNINNEWSKKSKRQWKGQVQVPIEQMKKNTNNPMLSFHPLSRFSKNHLLPYLLNFVFAFLRRFFRFEIFSVSLAFTSRTPPPPKKQSSLQRVRSEKCFFRVPSRGVLWWILLFVVDSVF